MTTDERTISDEAAAALRDEGVLLTKMTPLLMKLLRRPLPEHDTTESEYLQRVRDVLLEQEIIDSVGITGSKSAKPRFVIYCDMQHYDVARMIAQHVKNQVREHDVFLQASSMELATIK